MLQTIIRHKWLEWLGKGNISDISTDPFHDVQNLQYLFQFIPLHVVQNLLIPLHAVQNLHIPSHVVQNLYIALNFVQNLYVSLHFVQNL